MASFAKAQLLKYGWTEGKGLGKNENGIVVPLKPRLKFNTTGVGHVDSEYKWWESVYNKAASNVNVDLTGAAVCVQVKDKDAVEISTSKLDLKKLRKQHNLEYGSFLKTCTLDDGKILPDENFSRSALDEILHESPSFELSDEQLFQACGGRTAHKGARHGLTSSGKLARIAAQEAELLNLPKIASPPAEEWTEVKRKKKLKRKRRRSGAEMDLDESTRGILESLENSGNTDANANNVEPARAICDGEDSAHAQTEETRKKSKVARRNEKRRFENLVEKLNSVVIVDDSPDVEKKSTKKRKQKKKSGDEVSEDPALTIKKEHKKMKRKNRGTNDEEAASCNDTKKSRLSPIELVVLSDASFTNFDEEEAAEIAKKHKREHTEADKMNHRIEKKKKKRQAKTEKKRFERLSEGLMGINLCEDSVDSGRGEDLIESCDTSRKLKKWKKHRKEKKDKKMEEIIVLDT